MSGSPCPLPRRVDPLLGAKSAASPLVHSVAQSQQKCLSRYSSASNLMQTHWKNYLVALPTTILQDWKHLSSKLIYFMLPWTTSNSDPSVSFSLVLSEHMAAMRHMAPPNPMFHCFIFSSCHFFWGQSPSKSAPKPTINTQENSQQISHF
jgi:hypothetical protein